MNKKKRDWLKAFNRYHQRYLRNDAKKKTKGINKYGRKIKNS